MEAQLKFYGKDLQDIDFDDWLSQKDDALQPIVRKWHRVISNCGSEVQMIFHDGHPVTCVDSAAFAYIDAFSAHVNVGFFYGMDLPDAHGLLQGTGKRMRHIKLFPGEKHMENEIEQLVELAYADIVERLIHES